MTWEPIKAKISEAVIEERDGGLIVAVVPLSRKPPFGWLLGVPVNTGLTQVPYVEFVGKVGDDPGQFLKGIQAMVSDANRRYETLYLKPDAEIKAAKERQQKDTQDHVRKLVEEARKFK